MTSRQIDATYGPDWKCTSMFGYPGIGPHSFILTRGDHKVMFSREQPGDLYAVKPLK